MKATGFDFRILYMTDRDEKWRQHGRVMQQTHSGWIQTFPLVSLILESSKVTHGSPTLHDGFLSKIILRNISKRISLKTIIPLVTATIISYHLLFKTVVLTHWNFRHFWPKVIQIHTFFTCFYSLFSVLSTHDSTKLTLTLTSQKVPRETRATSYNPRLAILLFLWRYLTKSGRFRVVDMVLGGDRDFGRSYSLIGTFFKFHFSLKLL